MATGFRASLVVASIAVVGGLARPAAADPVRLGWPQPGGPGTAVVITYSYSNLLDGHFLLLGPETLRTATEEALRLWARYAPLHFVERPDSGPPPSDIQYPAGQAPQIRIGHHTTIELSHAFYPADGGLGGDIHVDSGGAWMLEAGPWNFLEAITHELGHALGLVHELERTAIMNPLYPQHRFGGLGTAFLMPADIEQLRDLYGAGTGSVTPADPVPEPGTLLLVGLGLGALARLHRTRRMQRFH